MRTLARSCDSACGCDSRASNKTAVRDHKYVQSTQYIPHQHCSPHSLLIARAANTTTTSSTHCSAILILQHPCPILIVSTFRTTACLVTRACCIRCCLFILRVLFYSLHASLVVEYWCYQVVSAMTAAAQSPRGSEAIKSAPAAEFPPTRHHNMHDSQLSTSSSHEPPVTASLTPSAAPAQPVSSTTLPTTADDDPVASLSSLDTGSTECPSHRQRRLSQIQLPLPTNPATATDPDSSPIAFASSLPPTASPLLPRSTSHVHALRDSEDVGIILADANQHITHVNSTFSAITGYSLSDSIGRNCNFLQGKHTSSSSRQRMRDAIRDGQTCQLAVLNYRKNGVAFWNLLTIAPMYGSDGRVTHYIGVQVPQSVVYIDRPMKLFAWRQGQEDSGTEPGSARVAEEADDAASIGGKGGMLLLPAQKGGLTHTRSMDWTREVKQTAGGRSISSMELREVDMAARQPSPPIELMMRLPVDVDELEKGVDDRSCARDEEKEEMVDAVDEQEEPPPTQTEQQRASISSTDSSLPSAARRPKALPSALSRATPVSFVAETLLPTLKGKYRVRAYKDLSPLGLRERREIMCILYGDVEEAARSGSSIALRVHDQCFTSEVLGSLKCDCREQLQFAMDYIQHNTQKCGIIIYLSQEGRGIGLGNKIKVYSVQERGYDTVDANRVLGFPDDVREYSCVPSVLDGLGVGSVRLMTNNPRKTEALVSLGVNVVGRIPVVMEVNEHSDGYIRAKQSRMGHQAYDRRVVAQKRLYAGALCVGSMIWHLVTWIDTQ